MKNDAFSSYHPLVNFLFFVGAIGFGVVIQHPAYLIASCVCGAIYYLLLHGKKGIKMIGALMPVFIIIAGVNPLLNTYGKQVLFTVFGRPYTFEALVYGFVIAGIFLVMMLWFGCYNAVLTSDKFVCLFGSLIPSLSLLLVMVLRMIPNFIRATKRIAGCRKSIGKGVTAENTLKEKVYDGMSIVSALTDWALEGSLVTADSMRARGYGCARRTSFQIYRMCVRDWIMLAILIILCLAVMVSGGTQASFTPVWSICPIRWGFGAYCLFLLIPSVLQITEKVRWRIFRSGI